MEENREPGRELSRDPLVPDEGLGEHDRTSRVGPVGMFVFAALTAALGVWAALSGDGVLWAGWGVLAVCWLVLAIRALRRRRESSDQVSSSRRR